MKILNKSIYIIFIAFLFTTVINTSSFGEDISNQQQKSETKVIAYYLHGSHRCPSCKTIEKWSHEAIKLNFQDELKIGKLVWKVLNFEEPQNKHFIKDYSLYTKSLIISELKGDKELKWKNLDKVWILLRDQGKFFN